MPRATLLLRESSSKSLKTIVESAQKHRQQNEEYDIDLRNGQLILSRLKGPPIQKQTSTDEGFESDIDSISLISTDDSFTSTSKSQETDSANGSACSDSDDAETSSPTKPTQTTPPSNQENFNLVNCVCYTDIKFPNTLIFVIQNETFVFKFDNLDDLQNLHSNFSAIKAVANQKAYGSNTVRKFNLLQRTDSNGVTHIEISRSTLYMPRQFQEVDDYEPSSIISISTPDNYIQNKYNVKKSLSTENLLDIPDEGALRKVWSSAENLLDIPKKPERRRPKKGPAPPPPTQNVLKGQFVRVNVLKTDQKPNPIQPPPTSSRFHFLKPKLNFQQFKFSDPKKIVEPWTNSMPRLTKKTRSETRLFPPMAYRYIDTTAPSYIPRYKTVNQNRGQPSTISNRLFGMSSKLKEFGSVQSGCNLDNRYQTKDARYGSLGNLSYPDGTLKSVIKKDDAKRKNDKKVTFSAYNTVQVV